MVEYFEIGQITNTHALKGELKVRPFTESKKRFEELKLSKCDLLISNNSLPFCDKKYFYQNYPNRQDDNNDKQELNINPSIAHNADNNSPLTTSNTDGMQLNPNSLIDSFQNNVINKLENGLIDDINEVSSNILDNKHTLNNSPSSNEIVEHETDTNNSSQTDFLNDIIYQLDEMFTRYPDDDVLKSIIPNSRFVRVDANPSYVLGVIYEDNMMKYIAYGVPATYNSLPPSDLGQHYQWLPLNPNDVMSDGYFMIFQDALNGTLVEINFEE